MATYPAGTPAWVDLASPDPDASARFYGDLFGWEAVELGDPQETGGYRQLQLDGRSIGGLSPLFREWMPPTWTTYVYVDDADATAAKVTDNGGRLMMEPFDVLDAGRMAVFKDPTEAVCALWQPRAHTGADLVNEPGSLCWNELQSRDPAAAKDFYPAVFGWELEHIDMEGGPGYDLFKVGERNVAGLIEIHGQWPGDAPSNWLVYFAVEDADERTGAARDASATVHVEPRDIPGMGRFAVLGDPHGAVFALWRGAS